MCGGNRENLLWAKHHRTVGWSGETQWRISFSNGFLSKGSYSKLSDQRISSLTEAEILDTINTKNVSQIFMKDFNFKELLGDVKYNSLGEIIGK